METMPIHPAADLFPMLPASELQALADDIKANGQREPVVIWDGSVLDGRNRLAACRLAGVEPLTRTLDSCPDPLAFVLSLNLIRRHLDESQRGIVAAKVRPMLAEQAKARQVASQAKPGEKVGEKTGDKASPNLGSPEGKSADQAADMLNVGRGTVEAASKVLKHGAPELVSAVERGEVAVSAAAVLVSLPEDEQREIVAAGTDAIKAKVKTIRESKSKREPKAATPAKTPGQIAEEKIRAATTLGELDAAYQEASRAGLSDRECEGVADARQERGAELRAQTQTTAPAPAPAAAQPAPVEVSVPVAPPAPPPTPPRGQVDLFTQPSVAVCTQEPAPHPVSAETVTVSRSEWEALQADAAEARGLRQWRDGIAARAGAGDEASVGKVMRLIALSGSPNEHEAASAALKASRMIRERGLLVVTSVAASGSVEVSEDVFEAMSRATAASWDRFEQRLDDIFNAHRGKP